MPTLKSPPQQQQVGVTWTPGGFSGQEGFVNKLKKARLVIF